MRLHRDTFGIATHRIALQPMPESYTERLCSGLFALLHRGRSRREVATRYRIIADKCRDPRSTLDYRMFVHLGSGSDRYLALQPQRDGKGRRRLAWPRP